MAEAKETKTKSMPHKANKGEKAPSKKPNDKPAKKSDFLEYKGRPLVRSGDTIYYGRMSDPYVICLKVLSSKEKNGIKISEKVAIQLLDTDPNTPIKEKVVKKGERNGLYDALDLGVVWLERALKNK